MEERLAGKIEATNNATREAAVMAKLTNDSLGALEEKVENGEASFKKALEKTEERIMDRVSKHVEEMVRHQLFAAGFDPSLMVGCLSTIPAESTSYAAAASKTQPGQSVMSFNGGPDVSKRTMEGRADVSKNGKDLRREERFWASRRSLRMWPVRPRKASGASWRRD